ncbi:PREDICTED: growth/differentiation factor 15 [Ceratotherium simum simum]|uniref:Growth/differentiation factor 15 n=1 Tax=Ceratotherium simum simum TaxID=73337 RepID=A0ABM0HAP6_CERSS|nr:PREDICTED: growth/differentiation factor 15 [Ceratotherium simum simum]
MGAAQVAESSKADARRFIRGELTPAPTWQGGVSMLSQSLAHSMRFLNARCAGPADSLCRPLPPPLSADGGARSPGRGEVAPEEGVPQPALPGKGKAVLDKGNWNSWRGFALTPPCGSPMLPLLLLLWWPPPGGALPPAREHSPAFPGPSDVHSSPDVSRVRELRTRYEHLQTRLLLNQTWEDSNPDLITAAQVRILTPKLRLGPDGHLRLRILRANLTEGLPAGSRLHQALLRLSPRAPRSWDVTQQLQRQLSLGASRAPALRLRLPPPSDGLLEALPSAQPQLELRWRSPAARGRRGAHAHPQDECPLGAGRCCRLLSLRASLEDLGWADWVVAPRELDVRMCVGACPSHFRSASRHAEVLARLHGLSPDAAPAPCCVPSSYEPVVLLHQDSDGRVTLTPFDDLVAGGCHCQ